ncbi:zinc ribbon domain-containing protein [Rubritalea marina]|uniref:zinc ribbon domain-containing protein n=1 Tax=Rubritalea marina TaxID=361055 RepID=UPI00037B1AA6|nr:C4-type zinc ribbon domain-containing protein [Rubritalea marina]
MLPEVESLLIVQDRDQKILIQRRELERVPRDKASAEDKLSNDKSAVSCAKEAYQENQVAIKNTELDIATRRDTIAKLKTQQFETKKNEEYTSLGKDVERYAEMIDELETQELELMEQADELKEKHTQAIAALEVTQKEVDQDIAHLEVKANECQGRLDELLSERSELIAKVDDNLITLYERLLKTKGNDPVVPLKGSQCGGCHMKVTPSTVASVLAEKGITQCENCGRILYQS